MEVPLIISDDLAEYHREAVDVVLRNLNTSAGKGLTNGEANERREKEGENLLVKPVNCPSFLCCLLPCLGNIKNNQYFMEVVPEDALVLRNGKWIHLDTTSLVKGDIVKVKKGYSIPADMRVISCKETTKLDQFPLTGKRELKIVQVMSTNNYFLENGNLAFLGSYCTEGEFESVVIAVGRDTVLQKLIKAKRWPPANYIER